MRKPLGMGSKFFCFSWMLSRDAPPPGLMDKRAVRRIHQADDSVIDGARQISGQVSQLVFLAESRNARRGNGRLSGFGESGPGGGGSGMKTQMKSSCSSQG